MKVAAAVEEAAAAAAPDDALAAAAGFFGASTKLNPSWTAEHKHEEPHECE